MACPPVLHTIRDQCATRPAMSLSTVFKIAIALLIAFFAIKKLRVHRADQRLRRPVATTQQPFADSPVRCAFCAAGV